MKLLHEIIDALSSQEGSLTDALLKTKVLLHKIGKQELIDWVNKELNGYPDADNVPDYRRLSAQVLVNASNRAYQVNSHPIPLGHLTDQQRDDLQTSKMTQSLAVLEKMVGTGNGRLQAPIPMDANGLLGEGLANDYMIQRAWCEMQVADVTQIFVQVRSRLLDFVLQLQDQLGENVHEQDIKAKSNSFDAAGLFNHAIFGDNITIVVGNNNSPAVSNVSLKGNFETMAAELKAKGVSQQDVALLSTAIADDHAAPELSERKFGPSVRAWLKSMMSKAVDASWQIELGVAGGILTAAIQRYYGWP